MYQKIIKHKINHNRFFFGIKSSFLLTLTIWFNVNALTLEMAIDNAKQKSDEFQKIESDLSSNKVGKVIAVETFLLPSVSLNARKYKDNRSDNPFSKLDTNTIEASYSVSNLYKGSLLGLGGIYSIDSQNNLLDDGKNNVILSVIEVYFDVLKAEKKIELYTRSLKLNEEILRQAETNVKLGSAKSTALYLAQTQVEEVKANLELAYNELETVKNRFILKVGIAPENLVEPKQTELSISSLSDLIEKVEKFNLQINSSRNQKTASKYNLSYTVSDILPDFSVKYERYKEDDLVQNINYSGNRVTLNARFYLYKPGIVSNVIQKTYDYHSSKNNHNFNVLDVKNKASDLWSKREYYTSILPSKERIVNIRTQIVSEWRTDYTYGRADLVYLLDEERKLVESELDLLQVKFESLKNIYQIKNIAGEKLW